MAANKPVSNYEEAIEEGDAPKEARTVNRIRANSTIMQLNKILGECAAGGVVVAGGMRVDGSEPSQQLPLTRYKRCGTRTKGRG